MRMLYILDLVGVAVFAISGALAGIRLGLDLFGVTVLAAVTAVGGGTVRDLLINRHPVTWIANPTYLYVILAATLIAILGAHALPNLHYALLVADAMGLGLFAIAGAQAVESQGHAWIVIILGGTLGGVAGGVIRDVLSGIVPLLLRRDIYATAAIGGIFLYLLMKRVGVPRSWASVIAMLAIVAVRLCAIAYNWQLPVLATPTS
jgi:uncharacterized membrane protein YeiH